MLVYSTRHPASKRRSMRDDDNDDDVKEVYPDGTLIYQIYGIRPDYRPKVHREIFELCYHGKGGFTWSEVYEMPVWLRRFYIREINRKHNEDRQTLEASKTSKGKKVTPPSFSPR